MFGLFKKKTVPQAASNPLDDTLFGDLPVSAWPKDETLTQEPWAHFLRARALLKSGKSQAAVSLWQEVTQMPGLEGRHYLQAWNFLRTYNIYAPEKIAKQVHGVVVEIHLDHGLDVLAAYPEHTARYYNHGGGGLIWEHPDDSLDATINELLYRTAKVAPMTGPWQETRRPALPRGEARLSILTPSGLHFGQGDMNLLFQDKFAAPALNTATQLMMALMDKSPR
jgi:hypothetical protein